MSNEIEFEPPSALAKAGIQFHSMHGCEELGRIPKYRIELLGEPARKKIEAKSLIGLKSSVKIHIEANTYRYIHGFITHLEHGGTYGDKTRYRVDLRPWLWQLTLGADCRIFQAKTVVEIIDEVFSDYAAAGPVTKKLNETYRTRPYTVQYRETDFNFVSRLMEEEGICFYFTHDDKDATLVLYDNAAAYSAIEGRTLVWFDKDKVKVTKQTMVTKWYFANELGSLKYTHTDFAADAPTADLTTFVKRTPKILGQEVTYPDPGKNGLEIFDYPGGYEDLAMPDSPATSNNKKEGERLAQIEVDRMESEHTRVVGVTPYRYMPSGVTFKFVNHPDSGEYLVTRVDFTVESSVDHSNSDGPAKGFRSHFEAVPKSVQFRPPKRARKPMVYGPQTATVVGADGDEILTDKYGRVKVKFHWDRAEAKNETSSCWIRVSQPWASKQFGMIALPRVGDEVVVDFLEGNPDRPLITGRVYNGDNLPPYTLPAQATVTGIKTQSSKGGTLATANELRFDDKKDSEYVWFQAEKDYHQLVKNDAFYTVQGNETTAVTKDVNHSFGANLNLAITQKSTVKADGDVHAKLGADLLMAITGALGLAVTGAVAIKGTQGMALAAGTDIDLNAAAGAKITATGQIQIKGLQIVLSADTVISLKAGPSSITLGPDGVSITGPLVKINSGGSAGAAAAAEKAAPASPTEPAKPPENKDPLAAGGGGG